MERNWSYETGWPYNPHCKTSQQILFIAITGRRVKDPTLNGSSIPQNPGSLAWWSSSLSTKLNSRGCSTQAHTVVHFDSCSLMRLRGYDRFFMKILYDVWNYSFSDAWPWEWTPLRHQTLKCFNSLKILASYIFTAIDDSSGFNHRRKMKLITWCCFAKSLSKGIFYIL